MDDTTTIQNSQPTLSARAAERKIGMDVRAITKSLPLGRERIDILRGISFQIFSGDFVSIVGPSGSGKSTLLGIIATHDPIVASHADRAIRIVDGLIASTDVTDGSITQ